MAVRPESNLERADWLVSSREPWTQLCTAGPGGFDQYARLFHAGTDEDVESFEGSLPTPLLERLLMILRRHTSTPEDCLFALWDGYGDIPDALLATPRVRIPHRSYLLFSGPLDDAGHWTETTFPGWPENTPNLMWPEDRAWFVATEVDLPWTSIAGTTELIGDILSDPDLDAEVYVATPQPPYWRD